MKQTNVIRVAVNPSNLIQPVKINDRVFKKNINSQSNNFTNYDIINQIYEENKDLKTLLKTQVKSTNEIYQDKSFIKSLIPKTRVYSFSSCK